MIKLESNKLFKTKKCSYCSKSINVFDETYLYIQISKSSNKGSRKKYMYIYFLLAVILIGLNGLMTVGTLAVGKKVFSYFFFMARPLPLIGTAI